MMNPMTSILGLREKEILTGTNKEGIIKLMKHWSLSRGLSYFGMKKLLSRYLSMFYYLVYFSVIRKGTEPPDRGTTQVLF